MQFDHQSSPGFAITRTAHALRSAIQAALRHAKSELSTEETQLMIALLDADEPVSMGDFAKMMMRDATTLTRQLYRLVERGFVARTPAESDRRIMLIALASGGRKELKKVLPILDGVRKRALAEISKSEIETTIRTLKRMQDNLAGEDS